MVKVNENKTEDIHPHGPLSSISSEDGSFVVLERSPPQQESIGQFSTFTGQQSAFPPLPMHNSFVGSPSRLENQVSQNSSILSADLSPEEIQKKLHELLQENLELKETLHQNNLAMKQQFATLAKWQEEVFKVHQNHKSKFAETKELVLKLRAENAELKRVLEEYKNAGSSIPSSSETELKMENVELKGKIAELQQKLSSPIPRKDHGGPPTKKELELSSLLEQVNRQLETAERGRRQLTVDTEHLTAQRTRLERDTLAQKAEMEDQKLQILELKKDRDTLNYKLSALARENGVDLHNMGSEVNGEQTIQANYQLACQVEEQRATISSLVEQLKSKGASLTSQGTAPQETSNMACNMRDYEKTLAHLSGCMDQEAVRLNSLDSWLQVAADNMNRWKTKPTVDMTTISTLNAEIQELRNLLAQEQAYSQDKRQNLEEAQKKFQTLHEDYQNVIKELDSHRMQQNKERHNSAYLELQAKGFSEKIDNMTAQLLSKEEALTQKNKEVDQIREKLRKLELENEAISILKAQVEVYMSDFNAEREARENLAGEKERLAEDLRHLQRRNQQLLDELEAYQQNQFEQIQRQTPQTTTTNAGGWSTIAAPGRNVDRRSPVRTSPGRPSPARSVSAPHQVPPSPQPPVEQEDRPPFRGHTYTCPKCEEPFTDYPKLEQHVEECLEL